MNTYGLGVSNGLTVYTSGVKIAQGGLNISDSVIATLDRVPNIPNNPGPYTPNLRTIVRAEVLDPFTVRLHTDRPNPTLPGQLTNIFIVSARLATGPVENTSARIAVGTGPYAVTSFRYGEGLTLQRNEAYWGAKPAYAQAQIRVISNDAAREAALLSGDIDLMENVPPDDIARLREKPGFRVFARPADRVVFLLPNFGAATLPLITDKDGKPLAANPMRDLKVRQAISLAIDRKALVERVLSGQGVPAMQLVPKGFTGWTPALTVPAPDLPAARALLAEAGLPQGFRISLSCTNDRYVYDSRICQTLAQMLTRVGITTAVDAIPGSMFMPRTRAGKNESPMLLYAISLSSLHDVAYILGLVGHSVDDARGFGDGNRGSFSDPVLDRIIEAAIIRSDAGRDAALQAAQQETVARLGVIPLYHEFTIAAARAGVSYAPRIDEQFVAQAARPETTP